MSADGPNESAHSGPTSDADSSENQGKVFVFATGQAERTALAKFCTEVPYPDFQECAKILSPEVELWAEYGEATHTQLRALYDSHFQDAELLTSTRDEIKQRGGNHALVCCYYCLNRIMNALATRAPARLTGVSEVHDASGAKLYEFQVGFVVAAANVIYLKGPWFLE